MKTMLFKALIAAWSGISVAYGQDIAFEGATLFTGPVQSMALDGDYAVCAAGRSLQILSVADPANPAFVSGYPLSSYPHGVDVSGDYAFIITSGLYQGSHMSVFDISNLTTPRPVSNYDWLSNPSDIIVQDGYAYLAGGIDGLIILNVTDPANPTLAGQYETGGESYGLCLAWPLAYMADGPAGLKIIDVADPSNPTFEGGHATVTWAHDVDVAGEYAYVAEGTYDILPGTFEIFDVSDPTMPIPIGSFDTLGAFDNVTVVGDKAYFTAYQEFGSDINVVDISVPNNPRVISTYHDYAAYFLVVDTAVAYTGGGSIAMRILDISDAHNIALLGQYNAPREIYAVDIAGRYAYVGTWGSGMWVVDVIDAASPEVVSHFESPFPYDICTSGDYAYLADLEDGLLILDVADPGNPILVGSAPISACQGIEISGTYAYVAAGDSGLYIVDVSNRSAPTIVGRCDTPGSASDVAVSGPIAAVSDFSGGLRTIDVSDPHHPVMSGRYDTYGYSRRVRILGHYAFLANDYFGLKIIDISNPAAPTLVGTYQTSDYVIDVVVAEGFAYLLYSYCFDPSECIGGVQLIDVTNLAEPVLVTQCETRGNPKRLSAGGGHILVADYYYLSILSDPLTGIDETPDVPLGGYSLIQNYPNPFNSSTAISFSLPERGDVNLVVFDILGRKVATLQDGTLEAGNHSMAWDAGDNPSGVYFYQLKAANAERTRSMVLVK